MSSAWKERLVEGLILVAELVAFTVTIFKLSGLSYDVLSITPLFLFRAYNYLMPLTLTIMIISTIVAIMLNSKFLLIVSSLILYYTVLYVPYALFSFPIYNDQLGFALEAQLGLAGGSVAPYQGESATLGHAYFTSVVGEILNLNLFDTVKTVKFSWIFISFIVFSALAFKAHNSKSALSLLSLVIILFFPTFILEPLVYSRGYFSIVISLYLFLVAFNLIKRFNMKNIIIFLILQLAMSISYPLQPLLVPIAMLLVPLAFKALSLIKVKLHTLKVPTLKTASVAFFMWMILQAWFGHASWGTLHEIIVKAWQMEFFTAIENVKSLSFVGEAATYVKLRVVMILVGWLLAGLLFMVLIYNILKDRRASEIEVFSLLLLVVVGIPAIVYVTFYHEPGLKFFRVVVSMFPIVIAYLYSVNQNHVINTITKILQYFAVFSIILFLVLNPIIKWGWAYVAYPTSHDISLGYFIVSHYEGLASHIYAPGSHQLLGFLFVHHEILLGTYTHKKELFMGGPEINHDRVAEARYLATFYRLFIYQHWLGKDTKTILNTIRELVCQKDLLYNDLDLWILEQNTERI